MNRPVILVGISALAVVVAVGMAWTFGVSSDAQTQAGSLPAHVPGVTRDVPREPLPEADGEDAPVDLSGDGVLEEDLTSGQAVPQAPLPEDGQTKVPDADSQHTAGDTNEEALQVIESFCRELGKPGEDWQARLSPLVTESVAEALQDTDPNLVPEATCETVEVVSSGLGIVVATARYDSTAPVDIRCEETLNGWRVTMYEQEPPTVAEEA